MFKAIKKFIRWLYIEDSGVPCIKILEAEYIGEHRIALVFSDGKRKIFDGSKLEGGVFEPLKDEEFFKNFYLERGAVTWNDELDYSPYAMYDEGTEVQL